MLKNRDIRFSQTSWALMQGFWLAHLNTPICMEKPIRIWIQILASCSRKMRMIVPHQPITQN